MGRTQMTAGYYPLFPNRSIDKALAVETLTMPLGNAKAHDYGHHFQQLEKQPGAFASLQ
jgi:hypothetical protein